MDYKDYVYGIRIVASILLGIITLGVISWFIEALSKHRATLKFHKTIDNIKPNVGDTFNPDKNQYELIINTLKYKTEGHCPCIPVLLRSKDTICPCATYRAGGECKCGLFILNAKENPLL